MNLKNVIEYVESFEDSTFIGIKNNLLFIKNKKNNKIYEVPFEEEENTIKLLNDKSKIAYEEETINEEKIKMKKFKSAIDSIFSEDGFENGISQLKEIIAEGE